MSISQAVYEAQIQRIADLQARLAAEQICQQRLAVRVLGQEHYDSSPCQAHDLELVEAFIEGLKARLAEAERLLQGVARGGHPAGMAALLSDIDGYFKPTADSADSATGEHRG